MKVCHFDAFSGISGDMTVGALLDAGADWKGVESAISSLNLGAKVRVEKTKRHGMAASKFYVEGGEQKAHRHLPQIEKIIQAGELSPTAQGNAVKVFRRLGEAEAQAHNVPIEKVHFHEVGAVDSICDIVGACVALDLLGVTEVHTSKINVGSGTVQTDHGLLPVPAPATAELLRDFPIFSSGPEFELTTPTGAALLATLATGFGGMPAMRVLAQGFGAGDKDFPGQANLLRVLIGEPSGASEATTVSVIEANIDDSTPQVLGFAMERLFAAGALDVTLSPVLMKKNRSGTTLTIICNRQNTESLSDIVFAETTTLGLRIYPAERRVLARQVAEVETSFGKIRVKYTNQTNFAPEYEDCRKAALDHGIPVRTVISEANQAFLRDTNKSVH